ncbi:UNVERIFIED_CONTAM: hypothetical protein GTU68_066188, partial [Idotea baltica]|nr:hypothetical protein [Idotea baltica]
MLQVKNLCKDFGALPATDDVTLNIKADTIHALIGPNGAGKTTLISQISGYLQPTSGSIEFDGQDLLALPAHRRPHIGLVRSFQITSVFPDSTVLDNVCLVLQSINHQVFRLLRPANSDKAEQRAAQGLLDQVGLGPQTTMLAKQLSHGQKRQLEIAMALAAKPKLLLLDEPMAGMGVEETRALVSLLNDLRGSVTMLLVEHDMDVVFSLADTLSVLVYGKVIATGTPSEIQSNTAVQVLFGVTMELAEGDVVSLMGRNGMGKTTTVRSVTGLTPAASGNISFRGQDITAKKPHRIGQAGIAIVPEGRQIFSSLTVRENLIATAANHSTNSKLWDLNRVYARFPRLSERANQLGSSLSGGEQQMLAIGRALMTNPYLLILDEATEGLAPLIRHEIWDVLKELKAEGQTTLVIDKNLDEM